ncbi:solute:Na+ symporter, SSS family [Parasphingorhabdus marina DSM 22363]|uniref:Solute:Na+ symporter, SSS family n=1 Tax=Parasphingorhabdus marina DSM 22363 TaxID=1123272 RepID=A0A1N6D3Q9_9SPHN|nr:sodium/solute symporter [Parasphingorhabdus marina]SIN65336.1 solute:Na+ symporter, SSS family [Parasphingorhabdus marina DSM 22363]
MHSFGVLNWTIVVSFLVANLALGYFLGRKVQSAKDYYLGSRETPWWAIGISVIATYVSALSFLGGPAWAYSDGLSALAIHLNYPLVIFAVITLFLPFFYNSGVASIYEYQERRFGPTSRSVMSLIFLISQALTTAAILYATAIVLQFVTGIDVVWAIIIITIIALIYTAMGGMLAVIWTDVFQAVVLFVGAMVIMFTLINNLPVPLAEALAGLKAEGKLSAVVTDPDITRPTTIWSGVIAMTLFHITVYGANQMMVQRTLGAKTIGGAKKAYLLMGFAAFPIYFLFFFVGVLCYAYYGGKPFENDNEIILSFATEASIPGLMGILTAAVLAASMSTLSSAFNSLATVSIVDFYKKFSDVPEGQGHYLKMSRWLTIFWAVVVIIPAIMYSNTEGSILEVLSKIGSFFVGAKLGMYALGFFSKHTTEKGLLVGVAVGFVMVWYVASYTDIAWPWYCAIGGGTNILVSIIASLIWTGRQKDWSPYSVVGQRQKFAASGEAIAQDGWYRLPGMVDRVSWLLLLFFAASIAVLLLLEAIV